MVQKIRIVLPTYNERENVKILIPRIFETLRKNKLDVDILAVDDSSPDGTADALASLGKKYPIRVISRASKMGLGSAYLAGFRESVKDKIDIIFEMDSDLSHDPSYIPGFVEKINEGFDVVIGERKEYIGWKWNRKLISWMGNSLGKHLAGIKINDLTSGYRAYRMKVINKMDLDDITSNGYAFQLEILAKAKSEGFKIGSIPIVFYDRKRGKSKLAKRDMVEFLTLAVKLRLGLADA